MVAAGGAPCDYCAGCSERLKIISVALPSPYSLPATSLPCQPSVGITLWQWPFVWQFMSSYVFHIKVHTKLTDLPAASTELTNRSLVRGESLYQ